MQPGGSLPRSQESAKGSCPELVEFRQHIHTVLWKPTNDYNIFSPVALQPNFCALAASTKLSVSFQLLDLGQSAGLRRRVISSSQGLC
jgi:hypothetical protein